MSLADRYFEGLEELMTDEQIEKFEPNQLGKVYLMLSSLYEIMKRGDL